MNNTNWGKLKHKSVYVDESNIVIHKHWGEYTDKKTVYIPDVSADIEKSMNKFSIEEFDVKPDISETEHLILSPADPLISYAIELHKHANKMVEIIRLAELAIESNLIPSEDAALLVPEMPFIPKRHTKNNLNFIPKDFTTFTEGEETAYPELSTAISKEVLTKSVATMFAHIGYETTHESVLSLLADVLEDFLIKIGLKFKTSSLEEDRNGGSSGYPCYPEKVLIELGFGGVKGLHDYYENRVVKYAKILEKRSKELNKKYESLLIPKCYLPDDSNNDLIRIKKEDDDVLENEMHFPATEGAAGFSSLAPGYQLLNSLEAQYSNLEH